MLKKFFILSLLMVAFIWGYISRSNKIFPYKIVNNALIAYKALFGKTPDEKKEIYKGKAVWYPIWEESGLDHPQATTYKESRGDENIFIIGNKHSYLDICPEDGCLAWIIDRDGKVLHAWKNDPDVFKLNTHGKAFQYEIYPVGGYLYPNGDILVNYHSYGTYPYSIGLAKFDKDSNLLWKKERFYHHWFTVDKQGRILTPGMKVVKSPVEFENRDFSLKCYKGFTTIENITILDSGGNLINQIDMLDSFSGSDLMGFLYNASGCDPFHMNIVSINEDWPEKYPTIKEGDLLVSFRSLNFIGILDKDTKLFKWYYSGNIARQHSAIFTKNGKIYVLDNSGGFKAKGSSRIVAIDVASKKSETVFPKKGVKLPPHDFYTELGGFINLDKSGKRMLVSFSYPAGFVWEIDIESGEVLWEYRHVVPLGKRNLRSHVYTARYVGDINFPLNKGKINK